MFSIINLISRFNIETVYSKKHGELKIRCIIGHGCGYLCKKYVYANDNCGKEVIFSFDDELEDDDIFPTSDFKTSWISFGGKLIDEELKQKEKELQDLKKFKKEFNSSLVKKFEGKMVYALSKEGCSFWKVNEIQVSDTEYCCITGEKWETKVDKFDDFKTKMYHTKMTSMNTFIPNIHLMSESELNKFNGMVVKFYSENLLKG